jgi:predicted dehydrogenase
MSSAAPDRHDRPTFAIVGAGVIGKQHGKVMTELGDQVELVAVVDVDLPRAEALAAERGGRPYASLADALANEEIDVVSVCTPTGLHGTVAIEALKAGRNVIIEKPAEVTVEKTDEIIAAQREAGTLVSVISQHRFDPATDIAVAAIEAGELGRLTSGIASIDWWRGQSYYDSGDWRGTWALDGGGAVMNQTVHTINLMITTLGTPVEVFAYTGCLAHERIEVEDTAVAVVKFASGALGMIHGTTAAYPGLDASLRIFGSKGSAVITDDELVFFHANVGDAPEIGMQAAIAENQVTEDDELRPGDRGLGLGHRRQLADFIDAVGTGRAPRVGTAEARTAVSVILAMYESAASGGPVAL